MAQLLGVSLAVRSNFLLKILVKNPYQGYSAQMREYNPCNSWVRLFSFGLGSKHHKTGLQILRVDIFGLLIIDRCKTLILFKTFQQLTQNLVTAYLVGRVFLGLNVDLFSIAALAPN